MLPAEKKANKPKKKEGWGGRERDVAAGGGDFI